MAAVRRTVRQSALAWLALACVLVTKVLAADVSVNEGAAALFLTPVPAHDTPDAARRQLHFILRPGTAQARCYCT